FSDPVTSRGDSIVTEDKVVSFATGFKRETECFEGTVDLTGGEESGGYWLGEKRRGWVRGLRRVFTRSERRRVQGGSTAGKLPWVLHRE
ncbi:unnamed protein product, partial [Brassica oleracea]